MAISMHNKTQRIIAVCTLCVLISFVFGGQLFARSFNHQTPDEKDTGYHSASIADMFDRGTRAINDVDFRELADFKIVDDETFKKHTIRLSAKPYDDPSLAYELYLPETWKKVTQHMESDIQFGKKLMSHITQYIAPPIADVRPTITVQAKRLEFEIDARHWLREHMLLNGFTLRGEVEGKDIRHANVKFVYVDKETAYTGYARAIFHGNMVTFIRFDVPQRFMKYYHVLQKKAVDSLKMLSPKTGSIEEWKKEYLLGDVLELQYPSSWQRRKPRYNEDGEKTAFELHNEAEEGAVYGLMNFSILRRSEETSLKTELNIVRKNLEEKYGMFVKELAYSKPVYGPLQFDYVREEKYIVGFNQKNISDQEMFFLVMANADWYVFIYMMSPLKDRDFYNWARNTRVYDIVKDSLL